MVWRTPARSLTPRWSKETATLMASTLSLPGLVDCTRDRSRALARAGPAAARRFHPRQRGPEIRPSDLVHVGRRPDGGPGRRVPALRLPRGRQAPGPPTDVLEGPRHAPA